MKTDIANTSWEYTRYAEVVMNEIKSEFGNYYSRETLKAAYDKFRKASKRDSNYTFLKCELEEMLEKSGIHDYDINSLQSISDVINTIPTSYDMYKSLFNKLYQVSKSFKSPKDYMKRTVRRLCDSEFYNDSVRLAIVKQFIKHTDYNTAPIIDYVISTSGKIVPNEERVAFTLEHIREDVFDNLLTSQNELSDLSVIDLIKIQCKVLISKFDNLLTLSSLYNVTEEIYSKVTEASDISPNEQKILKEKADNIKSVIIDNPDTVYMDEWSLTFPISHCTKEHFIKISSISFINALKVKESKLAKKWFKLHMNPYSEDICHKLNTIIDKYDEFALDMEFCETFCEYLNTLGDAVLQKISKDNKKLFNKYNNERKKDARKTLRPSVDWSLLRFADSLANGNFYTNGKTKNDLYMFAFAFNMTFCLDNDYSNPDPLRDIEKNLFHDYYNYDLLNYVEKDSSYEAEPTGAGINIKNFVETICLYFLSKNDMPTKEKLIRARQCIDKCKKRKKDMISNNFDDIGKTRVFKTNYNTISDLSEEELTEYICNNYYFDENNTSSSAITFASEDNTAYENLKIILSEIEYAKGNISEMRYVCGIEDVDEELKMMDIYDDKFKKLIVNTNKLLDTKADFFENKEYEKKRIKRTDIIIAAYYYKILESDDIRNQDIRNFTEVYEDFCDYVNPMLIESRYQPISTKNFFDIFMLMNLYRLSGDTPLQL